MSELNEAPLPCPFCGTEPRFCAVTDVTDKFDHGYTISCDTCGIEMADEYKSGVAEAWNRRTEALQATKPDAVAVEREAIDDLIFDLAAHHMGSASSWDHGACDFADKVREAIRARSQP